VVAAWAKLRELWHKFEQVAFDVPMTVPCQVKNNIDVGTVTDADFQNGLF
jgi:hypothetical protein